MLTVNDYPRVAILMATFNGMAWIEAQLDSILTQENVNVTLYVSDDGSVDGTYEYLQAITQIDPRVVLLPRVAKSGSAGQNFYRLIRDVTTDHFDYVAYADQDDIWCQGKLIRQINLLNQQQAAAVSSNVMAYWPNGTERLIVKSQEQRKWDYIFESAGPGCSFLMTPWLVACVRKQLLDTSSQARYVSLHDWLTYAVCRALGAKWVIDANPTLHYRQHASNVVGANIGTLAKWTRIIQLQRGLYRNEVNKISEACAMISKYPKHKFISRLTGSKSILYNLKLLSFVSGARRSFIDRLVLAVCLVLFIF